MSYFDRLFSVFLKHTAYIGLLVFVPLIAFYFWGHNIIEQERNKHILTLSKIIENKLKDIESEIIPESFLLKVSRGAWLTFKQNNNKINNYWNYYNKLSSFLNNKLDLYVFDKNGLLITPDNIPLKSRFLASRLWNLIGSSYEERVNTFIKIKKQLKSFMGNEFNPGVFIENRNHLTPILVNNKEGFVYWMNNSDNSKEGIMIIFWEIPPLVFRSKQIINKYDYCFENIFLMDTANNIDYYSKIDNDLNKVDYNYIFTKTALIDDKNQFLDSSNILWKSIKIDSLWLIGGLKSKNNRFEIYKSFINYFVVFIGILSSFVFWKYHKKNCYISIRLKIIILFAVSVLIPILGFSYMGYQYTEDIRSNLIIDFGNESRDILLNIDRELGMSGNAFRSSFKKMVIDYQKYNSDNIIRKNFDKYIEENDLVFIDRRYASDSSEISLLANQITFNNVSEISEPFSKCCIDTMLNTNLMDTVDPALKNAMQSPELGLTSFWARPDNVENFILGSLKYYIYWCFSDTDEYGKEFYLILRNADKVLRKYLIERLNKCKTNLREKEYLITVCNNKSEEWFPDNSLSKHLKTIARRISFMGEPIETKITINSKSYLLLAIRGIKLNGYSFYALYPYYKVEEKIKIIVYFIIFSIVIFVAIVLLIGYLLADTFIYPVKHLNDGVKALDRKDTDYRIEILHNDEFGNLALSFNNMLEELKEIELAKYVQESLLPQSIPEINGYQLSFANRMASGVGGDYFDIRLLDEDNLCLIIGDVSGHGVASALVMAIAKSIFYQGFKETRNLSDLFIELNSVVNTYFGKRPVKKMITLFASIINLSSGKSEYINAGHNFPMLISNDGNITDLDMINFPVGSTKKMKIKNISNFSFEKGNTIVFYTDGIIEVTNNYSEQYGYKRFKNNLTEIFDNDTKTIMDITLENYDQWKGEKDPDDDITLIVLKRLFA